MFEAAITTLVVTAGLLAIGVIVSSLSTALRRSRTLRQDAILSRDSQLYVRGTHNRHGLWLRENGSLGSRVSAASQPSPRVK